MEIRDKIRTIAETRYYQKNGERLFNEIIRDGILEETSLEGFVNRIKKLGDNWTVNKIEGYHLLRVQFIAGRLVFVKDVETDWFNDLTNFLKKD